MSTSTPGPVATVTVANIEYRFTTEIVERLIENENCECENCCIVCPGFDEECEQVHGEADCWTYTHESYLTLDADGVTIAETITWSPFEGALTGWTLDAMVVDFLNNIDGDNLAPAFEALVLEPTAPKAVA